MTSDSRSEREKVTRNRLRDGGEASREAGSAEASELPRAVRAVVESVENHKGIDLLVLDLRGLASFADFMVLCSGRSERHVQAVADGILEDMKADGHTPHHTEGYGEGTWILVDFVDFIVNVFTQESRDYYQLERVWRDAPCLVGERQEVSEGTAKTS